MSPGRRPAAFALDQEVLASDYEPVLLTEKKPARDGHEPVPEGLIPAIKYLMDDSGRDFAVVQEAPQSS